MYTCRCMHNKCTIIADGRTNIHTVWGFSVLYVFSVGRLLGSRKDYSSSRRPEINTTRVWNIMVNTCRELRNFFGRLEVVTSKTCT